MRRQRISVVEEIRNALLNEANKNLTGNAQLKLLGFAKSATDDELIRFAQIIKEMPRV